MKYKTAPLFILFLAISLSAQVSPPKKILGFEVGADYHLANYDQAVEYFNLLAKESPKFKVMEMGKTCRESIFFQFKSSFSFYSRQRKADISQANNTNFFAFAYKLRYIHHSKISQVWNIL